MVPQIKIMVPPTMLMDPLILLEIQPPNVQDYTTKYVMVSSSITLFKVPYALFRIRLPRDHVFVTLQMVNGP